jgi:hypothetical protein
VRREEGREGGIGGKCESLQKKRRMSWEREICEDDDRTRGQV